MDPLTRIIRQLAVIAGVVGALLLPSTAGTLSAGIVVAVVLACVVVATARTVVVAGGPAPVHVRARAALDRLAPRPSQSDPDARGHARPRAPGRLLTAV